MKQFNFTTQNFKFLRLLSLVGILMSSLFVGAQNDVHCDFLKLYGEPDLPCMQKAGNTDDYVFIIFDWDTESTRYITRVEKIGDHYKVTKKRVVPTNWDAEQRQFTDKQVGVLVEKEISQNEFERFQHLYTKMGLKNAKSHTYSASSSRGAGTALFVLDHGQYKYLSNGTFSDENHTYNRFSKEAQSILGL